MNEFDAARTELPSIIASLPENLRRSGAAGFLEIVEELRRSYSAELRGVLAVLTLDVGERDLVRRVRYESEFGVNTLDAQRTRCHNIDRIAQELLEPLRLKGDHQLVDRVAHHIEPLRIADNEFLDDIEDVLGRVAATAVAIDDHLQAGAMDEARAVQEQFLQDIRPRLTDLKTRLREMNAVANDLFDAV